MIARNILGSSPRLISFGGFEGIIGEMPLSSRFFPYTRVKIRISNHLLKGPRPIDTRTNNLLDILFIYIYSKLALIFP